MNARGRGDVLAEVAAQLRAVLAELDDPRSELTASRATRRRIEGAVLALEAAADLAVGTPDSV